MKFAVAILLLTLIAVQSSEAIKCYECATGTDCKKEVNCTGVCTKTSTTTAGVTVSTKACSTVKLENGCKDSTIAGVTSNICVCDSDLCNTGVASHVAIPLMIVAALLGRLM
ncbi:prostate stem cell antigen-like [Penaeus monodon]|uniref:prostate stem cell antigen-like n=1 Tax=Penaeus monodon TaxID=6687 RepID=UPI0018A6D97E|nr:prostate stem cell antigen-like [Penaeus monodon]